VQRPDDVGDALPGEPAGDELPAELVHAGNVDFPQGERAEGGNKMTPDGALVVQPGRGMQVGVLDDLPSPRKGDRRRCQRRR
jgi:hypothetical protein